MLGLNIRSCNRLGGEIYSSGVSDCDISLRALIDVLLRAYVWNT